MGFTAFPSIESFAHAVKAVRRDDGFDAPSVPYGAKIKLHGTNGGIRLDGGSVIAQSRSRDITTQDDNAGFAGFVETTTDHWRSLPLEDGSVVFGEWAGPGIQKGDAITMIARRTFFVFAIRTPRFYLTSPGAIRSIIGQPEGVEVLPWHDQIVIDFASNDRLTALAADLSQVAEAIGERDPYVADTYGIDGPGEGLVFMPISPVRAGTGEFGRLSFKVKCEAHRVRKVKAAASVGFELSDDMVGLARSFITPARCEQALSEGCGGIADKRRTPDFLKWIGGDAKKESAAELEAAGVDWKRVAPIVTREALAWWFAKCEALTEDAA